MVTRLILDIFSLQILTQDEGMADACSPVNLRNDLNKIATQGFLIFSVSYYIYEHYYIKSTKKICRE